MQGKTNELYDLKKDPFEMKNVISDPSAEAALKNLQAELRKILTDTK